MSEQPAEIDEAEETGGTVLTFTTPTVDPGTKVVPFRLDSMDDDEPDLHAVRPKQAKLVDIVKGLGDLDNIDGLAAAGVMDDLMRKVFDADTLDYLDGRFQDDDDDLDLDVLEPILKALIGVWYGGPTGRRPGSSGSPKRNGARSTGRSRSKASTR
jgi:hypothetical protein